MVIFLLKLTFSLNSYENIFKLTLKYIKYMFEIMLVRVWRWLLNLTWNGTRIMQLKIHEQIKINKFNSGIIMIQVLTSYQFIHVSCPKYFV